MVNLRNRLVKLHAERTTLQEQEADLNKNIHDLKEENTKLRRALADSERMREALQDQMEEVLDELFSLRRATAAAGQSRTFKDFVQLRRELAQVKQENEDLKMKISSKDKSNSLPSLKGRQTQSSSTVRRLHSGKAEGTHCWDISLRK